MVGYMLPVLPLDIVSYILYGFDIRFIAKLRFLNRAHRKNK